MKMRMRVPFCLFLMLMDPAAPASANPNAGGGAGVRGGLGTVVPVGQLAISVDAVALSTCIRDPRTGFVGRRAGPGWIQLDTRWKLRNPTNHRVAVPHAAQPGFRLVGAPHLFSGFYTRVPTYDPVIIPHTTATIWWTFAIRRDTRRVFLTVVPPGPHAVLWSVPVPPLSTMKACT